jgi:uncharacterized DUF497 family protein
MEKAHRNILKHGISFNQAITAFDDPFALIAPGEKHSSKEEIREWLIGESDDGRKHKLAQLSKILLSRLLNNF